MKWVFSLLVRWARRAGTGDFCPTLAAQSRPSTKYLQLTVHYFTSFVPIVQQAGQAVVPHRLSLITYLWIYITPPPLA